MMEAALNLVLFCSYGAPLVVTGIFRDHKACQIVHYFVSVIACAHVGYWLSWLVSRWLRTFHQLICFYKRHTEWFIGGLFTMVLNAIYFTTVYKHLIDDGSLGQISHRMFATTLLTTAYLTLIQGIYLSLCFVLFYMHHNEQFKRIMKYDQAITFDGRLKQTMDVVDSLDFQTLKYFVQHWKGVSDEVILNSIASKKKEFFEVFKEHLDIDNDNRISYDEFVLFAHKNNVFDSEGLWNFFTQHQASRGLTVSADVTYIDDDVIEHMLYHKLFQKQQFAIAMNTDSMMTLWITTYMDLFLLPLLGIIISSVWGYTNAFQGSFSLFQLYILVATFLANRMASSMKFAAHMTIVRPFNLGELLYIDNDLYKVTKLTPTFISCVGRDTIVMENEQMVNKIVHNYSRTNVADSLTIELPLNTHENMVDIVKDRMIKYAKTHWKEIDGNSIGCVWIGVSSMSKNLLCTWKYNFMVYDRSRYNGTRAKFIDDVIRATINDVSKCALMINATQCTEALSDIVVQHYHSHSPTDGE